MDERQKKGERAGRIGIALNLLLAAGKCGAGILAGSLAMTADALNNLTDALSSIVTLVGFRVAGRRADRDHPFGHGRAEYIAGFLVSVLVCLVGVELLRSAVGAIFHPEPVRFSWVAAGVLLASILVKLWMWRYNRRLSEQTDSPALRAVSVDALTDCAATGAVLAGTLVSHCSGVVLDGYLSLGVALFILREGYRTAMDTMAPLMGTPPDSQLVENLRELVAECPEILGVHDMLIHDYGPGRVMATLHAEVAQGTGLLAAHDAVDRVERRARERYGVELVIHMDPVAADGAARALEGEVLALAQALWPQVTIHDFRVIDCPDGPTLDFDVVLPFECPLSPAEFMEALGREIKGLEGAPEADISVDRPMG